MNQDLIFRLTEYIKSCERQNLTAALKAHGGEYFFEGEQPIVPIAAPTKWDGHPCDMRVSGATLQSNGHIMLHGEVVDASEVFASYMQFIIDDIV